MSRSLILVALVGCGSSPAPVPEEPAQIALAAPAVGSDDVVVATVDGRPVWASCVAAQASAQPAAESEARRRDLALHECLDFELLAQAAEKRGLGRDHDVLDAHRTELVSRLIARDFEDVYRQPADFKGAFDPVITANAARQHEPEFRASAYVRVQIPDHPTAEDDAAAHAIATRIAAAVADQTGMFGAHLFEIGEAAAGRSKFPIVHAEVPFSAQGRLTPEYGAALFSLPAIGRSAGPFRTTMKNHPDLGGWDVLVWTDVMPAVELTHDQLVTEMFPELRRVFFTKWVDQIARSLGVHVVRDDAQLKEAGT